MAEATPQDGLLKWRLNPTPLKFEGVFSGFFFAAQEMISIYLFCLL